MKILLIACLMCLMLPVAGFCSANPHYSPYRFGSGCVHEAEVQSRIMRTNPYVHLSNMSLDFHIVSGSEDFSDSYPFWWNRLGCGEGSGLCGFVVYPFTRSNLSSMSIPTITGGTTSSGFWLNFDSVGTDNKLIEPIPACELPQWNRFRTSFDYDISGLPSNLSFEILVYKSTGPQVIWHSASSTQQGHFYIDQQIESAEYLGVEMRVVKSVAEVPEPSAWAALLAGFSGLGMFRRLSKPLRR